MSKTTQQLANGLLAVKVKLLAVLLLWCNTWFKSTFKHAGGYAPHGQRDWHGAEKEAIKLM